MYKAFRSALGTCTALVNDYLTWFMLDIHIDEICTNERSEPDNRWFCSSADNRVL